MVLSHFRLACVVLLVAASAGVAAPVPEGSEVLRFKFRPGATRSYALVQKMKMTMSVGGTEIVMKMDLTMDMTCKVVKVDKEANGLTKQTIDRMRLSIDGATGKEEIDSQGGKGADGTIGKMLAPFLKAVVDAPFDVTMAPTGAVKSMTVPEGVIKAAKAMPGFGEMFSEDGLKQLFGQSGFVLPKGVPVKGKSWQEKRELKMAIGKMTTTSTQSYQGRVKRDGKMLAAFSLAPVSKFENNADAAAPIKITQQKSKGTAYFDPSAGWLTESVLTSSMDMEVGDGMGGAIIQKIEQTVTFKVTDKTLKASEKK
jgi:hypothetical protein